MFGSEDYSSPFLFGCVVLSLVDQKTVSFYHQLLCSSNVLVVYACLGFPCLSVLKMSLACQAPLLSVLSVKIPSSLFFYLLPSHPFPKTTSLLDTEGKPSNLACFRRRFLKSWVSRYPLSHPRVEIEDSLEPLKVEQVLSHF